MAMYAVQGFTVNASQSITCKNVALVNFSVAVDAIRKMATAASYLCSPGQGDAGTTVLSGYINASYPDFLSPIDDSKAPEFFCICLAETAQGKNLYLYSGTLTASRRPPVVTSCGSAITDGAMIPLLSSSGSGDFDILFSRPKTPANLLRISLTSNNPAIPNWLKWDFTALTQQPATINSQVF